MRSALEAQSLEDRNRKSLKIQKKLLEHPAFRNARTVCFFVGMDTEVNTVPMIEESLALGKRVLVPRVHLEKKELRLFEVRDLHSELSLSTLGILEPNAWAKAADPASAECVFVPGLAFDAAHNRLGRGAGYYDRLLPKFGARAPKIGLAFSFQVLPEIPCENHDHPLDEVLTEK
jgi:5-formyltetrahydrofolate cyclo-ligase